MGANEIQKSLLDYVSIMAQNAVNSTNANVTIKGEILRLKENSDGRTYIVSYGGTEIEATAIADTTYSASTIVYVLIPNGDFNETKIILGALTPAASNYVTEVKNDSYISLSDNILGSVQQCRNKEKTDEIYLRTWENETYTSLVPADDPDPDKDRLIINDNGEFHSVFKDYLNNYRTFKLIADIQTDIDTNHKGEGNYGIIFTLPFVNSKTGEKVLKTYSMTNDNVEGDPFDFTVFNHNEIYFTVEDGLVYDSEDVEENFALIAYTEGFNYSDEEKESLQSKTSDIIIKNISIEVVDVLSEKASTGYYLTVVSDNGHYFTDSRYKESKNLKPVLKVKGKTTSTADWDCYWFMQDYSVDTKHPRYLQIGGIGWKCINEVANISDNNIYEYVTKDDKNPESVQIIEVPPSDVAVELKYKCVLTKVFQENKDDETTEQTIVVGNTISLKNLRARTELSLRSSTGSNIFAENISDVGIIAQIKTDVKLFSNGSLGYNLVWQRFDKDDNFIPNNKVVNKDGSISEVPFYTITKPISLVDEVYETINNNKDPVHYYIYELEISFPSSLINQFNTVYCSFYRIVEGGNINLGTRSILVSVAKEVGYTAILENADVLYKYDSDGDSPMIANYDGPISSIVKTILPITFKIFKPDGHELTDKEYASVKYEWYLPKKSLMNFQGISTQEESSNTDYIIIKDKNMPSIVYTIAEQYDKQKALNNTILFKAEFDGNEFSVSANPKFMKDGESGTNGSKYAAIITYDNYAYEQVDSQGIARKLHLVWIDSESKWYIHDQTVLDKEGKTLNEKLISFDNIKPFEVSIYKDGALLLDSDDIKKTWEMFDPTHTNDCFTVSNTGTLTQRKDDAGKWLEGINPCPVVQCKITIETEQSNLAISNQETIYAWYPIEVTFIRSKEENMMLPVLHGGFSEVLYTMDGNNPEWDSTKLVDAEGNNLNYNFLFANDTDNVTINNIDGTTPAYTYKWSVSGDGNDNLKTPNVDKDYRQYASISPASKYRAGITENYIKVAYTWNPATITAIKNKIEVLDEQIKLAEKKKAKYVGTYKEAVKGNYKRHPARTDDDDKFQDYECIYSASYDKTGDSTLASLGNIQLLQNLYDSINIDKIKELEKKLSSNFLTHISSAIECLHKAQNLLIEWYNYCIDNAKKNSNSKEAVQEKCSNTLNIFKDKILEAYQALYLLGINNNLDGLQLLATIDETGTVVPYSIALDKIFENNFKSSAIANIGYYAMWWDDEVTKYNQYINELIKVKSKSDNYYYLNDYNNLADFKNYLNNKVLNNDNFTQLVDNFDSSGIEYPEDTVEGRKNRIDFYDDDNVKLVSAQNIDSFKRLMQNLNDKFTKDQDGYNSDSDVLYSYSDYLNNFLTPLGRIVLDYIGSSIENLDYKSENIQEIFNDYIKRHKDLKTSYENLLNNQSDNTTAIYIKPIIIHSNTAGLGYINGWNGSKLYIDEDRGQYIMAPIMGAGAKNEDGKFTGTIMGLISLNSKSRNPDKKDQLIGLHGLKDNERTFFINSKDGSAIFGKGTGQIVVDPSQREGLIYSADYFGEFGEDLKPSSYKDLGQTTTKISSGETYTRHGMLIKFTGIENDPPFIHFADAKGKIYSGKHNGHVAEDGFCLDHTGLSIGTDFWINTDGAATIEKSGSTVGGWSVKKHEGLETNGIIMDASTSTIRLKSSAGKIYSGNHSEVGATNPGFFLSQDGLSMGDQFKLDTRGTPYIIFNDSNAYIRSGMKESHGDTNPGFLLDNYGLSIGPTFTINATGITTIKGDGSSLGGWKVKTEKDGKYGLVSSTNEGIFMDSKGSTIILGSDSGKIYSGEHITLASKKKGFYISNSGMSIWNMFRVSSVKINGVELKDSNDQIPGKIEIGNLNSTSNKYWTIGGFVSEGLLAEWPDTVVLAKGPRFQRNRKENKELLKLEDTPFIIFPSHVFGNAATYITVTRETDEGTLYMTKEGKEMAQGLYDLYIQGIQPWPYSFCTPEEAIATKVNCKVSDGTEHPKDDGKARETEKKYTIVPVTPMSSWESYIAYNADGRGFDVDEDSEEITIDTEKAKKGSVYLGTDGLRLGRGFAVDPATGSGYLKGHIESSSGTIGGWNIDKKGLYGKYVKHKAVNYTEKNQRYYYTRLEIQNTGDITLEYYKKVNDEYVEISDDERTSYVGENGRWHLFDNGEFHVIANDSYFGGVHLIKGGGTFFESNISPSTNRSSGIFRDYCYDEIQSMINDKISNALKPGGAIYEHYGM